MNSYEQHGNETKFDEREMVNYIAEYLLKGSEGFEDDETDRTSASSDDGADETLSTLAEPEDWQRGYD